MYQKHYKELINLNINTFLFYNQCRDDLAQEATWCRTIYSGPVYLILNPITTTFSGFRINLLNNFFKSVEIASKCSKMYFL